MCAIANASKVVVLENGCVAEAAGSSCKLRKQNGIFARMIEGRHKSLDLNVKSFAAYQV